MTSEVSGRHSQLNFRNSSSVLPKKFRKKQQIPSPFSIVWTGSVGRRYLQFGGEEVPPWKYSGFQLLFFAPLHTAKLIFSQKVCSAKLSKQLSYLVDVRNRYLNCCKIRSSKYLMLKTKSAFEWSAKGFKHHVILSPLAKMSCLQSCISSALYSFQYCITTLLCLVDNYSCHPVYIFLVAIPHTSP